MTNFLSNLMIVFIVVAPFTFVIGIIRGIHDHKKHNVSWYKRPIQAFSILVQIIIFTVMFKIGVFVLGMIAATFPILATAISWIVEICWYPYVIIWFCTVIYAISINCFINAQEVEKICKEDQTNK